ncbi:MAG: hypothetical protein Fur0041_13310 [Bacteroidia bacterium]
MNNSLKYILVLFLMLSAVSLSAQIRKGNRLYKNKEFAQAIPAYEKGLKKKQTNAQAMENLANCYRITKNYKKAEEWYGKTIAANPSCNPMVYFYYGVALKNNKKYPEAKEQFKKFLGKDPQNKLASRQVETLDDIELWLAQTPMYDVRNAGKINTEYSDIAPCIYSDGLLFASDRGEVDILNGENDAATGRSFYAIYFVKKTYEVDDSVNYGKVNKLSRTINKDFHNGPASVSADGKLMAFNRVDRKIKLKNKKFVNRPKIYFTEKKNKLWTAAKPFSYNSDEYSLAHPALSADGKMLLFSSDMPGGQGGKDIWFSVFDGTNWSKPVNAGPEVNTPADEVFPYLRNDGTLFFSSDGHSGLGGLDIFSATKDNNGKWNNVANQGSPLNGPTDDFGITFNAENNRGYFTSDREGGKGSDDVYAFKVTSKFLRISGKLLSSKNTGDIMPNTRVDLLTKDGKLIKSTTSDAKGQFNFENLPADQSYIVRMNEDDPALGAKSKYYMADEKNNLVRVTVMDEVGGKFTFQNLPVDPAAPPQLLADDEYLTIAGNMISEGTPPQPIANAKVSLKDEKGNVVQTTTTNAFGAFAFTRIPPDQTYIVSLDENDTRLSANSKISITNKSGKELMTTRPDANGKFSFKIIPEDKSTISAMSVNDTELRMDMKGTLVGADANNTALANTKMNIMDDKGQVVQSVVTDDKGFFNFINLPSDKVFMVSVDDVKDPSLAALGKIYIKDVTGKIVKTLKMNGGKFEFRVLPLDKVNLGYVYVDDPWLQVMQMKEKARQDSLLIIENIYYDYGDYKILPAAEITLEKVVKVMLNDPSISIEISSHTDSRSSNDYNMQLSRKRANAVVDYLVKRGIDKKRLTAVGYGEAKLLNKCADGVDCTEEEHAKNRRTEFKINKK